MTLIKSRQRIADHGEVFTPPWMVNAMLDLVKGESERIDSRFLEPACGTGNFLAAILRRKLAAVDAKFGKSPFERRHFALLGLMCIYGIEILEDNVAECRAALAHIFTTHLELGADDELAGAAASVLSLNIIHGDALGMLTSTGAPITFSEWGYLGKGRFQRRDFRLDRLTQSKGLVENASLFAHLGRHEVFMPARVFPPLTVADLGARAERRGLTHAG